MSENLSNVDSFENDFQTENSLHLEQHKILLGSIEDFTKAINNVHLENDLEIKNLRSSLSIQLNSNSIRDFKEKSQTFKEINMLEIDQDMYSKESCADSHFEKFDSDLDLSNLMKSNKRDAIPNKIFMSEHDYDRDKKIQESPEKSKAFKKKTKNSPNPKDFAGKLKLSLNNLDKHSCKLFESTKEPAIKNSESLCNIENKIFEMMKSNEEYLEGQDKINFDSEYVSGESKNIESLKKDLEKKANVNICEYIKNSHDCYLSYSTPYFYQNVNSFKASRQNSSANSNKDNYKSCTTKGSQKTSNFVISEPLFQNSQKSQKDSVENENKIDLVKETNYINLKEDFIKKEICGESTNSSKKNFKVIGKSEEALNKLIQKFEINSIRNSLENPHAIIPVSSFDLKTHESNTTHNQPEKLPHEDDKLLQNNILIEDLDETSPTKNNEKVQSQENCTKRIVRKISKAQIGAKDPNIIDQSERPDLSVMKQNLESYTESVGLAKNKDISESYQSRNYNDNSLSKNKIGTYHSKGKKCTKQIPKGNQNVNSRYNERQTYSNCINDSTYGSTSGFKSGFDFHSNSIQQESSLKVLSSNIEDDFSRFHVDLSHYDHSEYVENDETEKNVENDQLYIQDPNKLNPNIYQDEEEIKIVNIETCEYDTYKSPDNQEHFYKKENLLPDGCISSRSIETKKSIKKLYPNKNLNQKKQNMSQKNFENIIYNDENKENELNAFWDMKNIDTEKITNKLSDLTSLKSEKILKAVKNKVKNCSTFTHNRISSKNLTKNKFIKNFTIDSKIFNTNSSSLNVETQHDHEKDSHNQNTTKNSDFYNSKKLENQSKCNLNIQTLGQLQTQ